MKKRLYALGRHIRIGHPPRRVHEEHVGVAERLSASHRNTLRITDKYEESGSE
jgi:hypothetical protein